MKIFGHTRGNTVLRYVRYFEHQNGRSLSALTCRGFAGGGTIILRPFWCSK